MNHVQSLHFGFRGIGYGERGACPVEVRVLNPGRVMVVLTETGDTGCGTVQESIATIATQFRQKHLRSYDPESISWVIFVPASAEGNSEDSYQRVSLAWDGERFDIPRKMARFNRNAFMSAVGDLSRSA